MVYTGCLLNIVFFSFKCCEIFLNSVSSAAALVFYLPGVCTHTDTEGKQREARFRNIINNSEKNTIFNEHPVPDNFKNTLDITDNLITGLNTVSICLKNFGSIDIRTIFFYSKS